MQAEQLLERLTALGVEVGLEGQRLRVSAPKGSLTPPLRQELTENKAALLALLADKEAARRLQDGPQSLLPRPEKAPLSYSQKRIWFLHHLDDNKSVYNMGANKRLGGLVDAGLLQECLQGIVSRHEILRTTYDMEGGDLWQCVRQRSQFLLDQVDLSHLQVGEQLAEAVKLAAGEHRRPFDLATDLMLRATLFHLAPDDHLLAVTMHHIASDGWSFGIFWDELSRLYEGGQGEEASSLPDLPLQYIDYTLWQRDWMQGERLNSQLAYWRKQLQGVDPLNLPLDKPRSAVQSHQGLDVQFSLSKKRVDKLKDLSSAEGATLFMTLFSAFSVILKRYTGHSDIAIGTMMANRRRPQIEGLIGLFLNTLVLRMDLDGQPTFRQLLKQARQVTLEAYDHQDIPFEMLLEELQPQRDLGQNPLFQALLVLENTPGELKRMGNLTVEDLEPARETSKLDLSLYLEEFPDGMLGTFEFNSDIYERETIERMVGHFKTLLEGIASDPDQKVSALPLLTHREKEIFKFWNESAKDYGQQPGLISQFYKAVGQYGSKAAFIAGHESLTFDELNRQSNQLAHLLLHQGVKKGQTIGLCLPRSLQVPVAMLAIFKIGGVYLPLDPGYPQKRLRYMAENSGVETLITGSEWAAIFADLPHSPQVIKLDEVDSILADQPAADLNPELHDDQTAYIVYTSGSTGRPKGVLVPYRQILNRLAWMWEEYPLAEDDVGCQKTALSFVDSLWELLGYLLQGKPTVMLDNEDTRDPQRLVEVLGRHEVTQLWLVPSLLRAMLNTHPDLARRLPKLRVWVSSGEALPVDLMDQFQETMPHALLYNLYGTSEIWDATWFDPQQDAILTQGANVSIGRPISNTKAYILDGDLNQVPVGVPGELCISGIGLGAGYIDLPQVTAERFVPHPLEKSDPEHSRLYRSGDLVRWLPDGQIDFLGRIDQQFKIRGHRVEPGEIESLLRQRDEIKDAAVIKKGADEQTRLVAFVTAAIEQAPDPATLKPYLSAWLPEPMVPWKIVPLPAFPHTPSGKVDRGALEAIEIEVQSAGQGTPPGTLLETKLVEIWIDVLNAPQVGIHDNFFELGGHSLLGVTLFSRIEDVFGVRLPLSLLFQAPTVAQLAEIMEQEGGVKDEWTLVAVQPKGSKPPFFFVHGLWGIVMDYMELARALGPEQPFYGLRASDLNIDAYPNDTIEAMAERYISEIQSVQPGGPYRIGGFSYGGLIAYEIARQLVERGEQVALLAVVEGIASKYATYPITSPERWKMILSNVPNWPEEYRSIGHEEISRWSKNKLQRFWARVQRGMGKEVDLSQFRLHHSDAPGIPERFEDLAKHHMAMLNHFKLRPYDGKVTLFRSSWHTVGRAFFGALDPEFGWGHLANEGVDIRKISGNHHTLLHQPDVAVLARQVSQALDEAAGQGPV